MPEAEQDRLDIREFISNDNPQAALRMDVLFSEAVARLAEYPHSGRPGDVPGTRELIPHESYKIVYEVAEDIIFILVFPDVARFATSMVTGRHPRKDLGGMGSNRCY